MAYNLGNLISQVQTRLDDTGYSSTTITQFINDTQREIFNNYTLQFMENTATLTTVANVASAGTLPADYQVPIDLTIVTPVSYAGLLNYVDFKAVDGGYTGSLPSNVPMNWYSYGGDLFLDPVPDRVYTLQLRYLSNPVELVNPSDVPQIPEAFQEVLVLGGLKRCLQVDDSYDQAAVIQINEFDPLVARMVQRYSTRQQAGPIIIPTNRKKTRGYWV